MELQKLDMEINMLEINNKPLQGIIKSGIILRKGEIAQLYIEDNAVVIGRSDGICPVGVVIQTWKFGRILNNPEAPSAEVEFRSFSGETDVTYPVNAMLFASKNGLLTTKRESSNNPSVGMVSEGPTAGSSALKFIWF